jgi:hypothetical protein
MCDTVCLNGGRCVRRTGRFMCHCPYYFSGDSCQLRSFGGAYDFVQEKCPTVIEEKSNYNTTFIVFALIPIILLLLVVFFMIRKISRIEQVNQKLKKAKNHTEISGLLNKLPESSKSDKLSYFCSS